MGFRKVLAAASVMATLTLASAQEALPPDGTVPVVVVAEVPVEAIDGAEAPMDMAPPPENMDMAPPPEDMTPAPEESSPPPPSDCDPIGDVLNAQQVSTLVQLVGMVATSPDVQGLVGAATAQEQLPADQQYTLFAPSDPAFAELREQLMASNPALAEAIPDIMGAEAPSMEAMPPMDGQQQVDPAVQQALAQVLGTHIVQGAYSIQAVIQAVQESPDLMFTVPTITGQTLVFEQAVTYTYDEENNDPTDVGGNQRGVITINVQGAEQEAKALVLNTNLRSCAGIVHVIDEVLQPGTPMAQPPMMAEAPMDPAAQPQPADPNAQQAPAAVRKLLGVFE